MFDLLDSQKPEPKPQAESYLREPPPITPRQINNAPPQREPEAEPPKAPAKSNVTIYLEKYCPLTLAQVKKDKSHLVKFKSLALKQFNEEMREIGIDSVSSPSRLCLHGFRTLELLSLTTERDEHHQCRLQDYERQLEPDEREHPERFAHV